MSWFKKREIKSEPCAANASIMQYEDVMLLRSIQESMRDIERFKSNLNNSARAYTVDELPKPIVKALYLMRYWDYDYSAQHGANYINNMIFRMDDKELVIASDYLNMLIRFINNVIDDRKTIASLDETLKELVEAEKKVKQSLGIN